MAIILTKDQLLKVVAGESLAQPASRFNFEGVEFDSRSIKGGELFVALRGEKEHGHAFVQQAFSRGASLCLVEKSYLTEFEISDPELKSRLIFVQDTLEALWKLAAWWRIYLGVPVLAVTGSVGKTTVKELCASILLKWKRGIYSLKSHNNHVGVPYTLLRLSSEDRWAVIEMGMNHAGEIAGLSKMTQPDVALITALGPAHIEALGSLENIKDAKFEITQGLKAEGTLIVNDDFELLSQEAKKLAGHRKVMLYGSGPGLDCSVQVNSRSEAGLSIAVMLSSLKDSLDVKLGIPGVHNALNAAGAVLACKVLVPDLKVDAIKKGLESFQAPVMRLNLRRLLNGCLLIDDSYNANPLSMQAALSYVADTRSSDQKLGLVLGEMRELGSQAERYHLELCESVVGLKPTFVVVLGQHASLMYQKLKSSGVVCYTAESALHAARICEKFNVELLLIKGSRTIGLEGAREYLLEKVGEMPPHEET